MAYGIEVRNSSGNLVITSASDVILNEETISVSTVTATGGGGSVSRGYENECDSEARHSLRNIKNGKTVWFFGWRAVRFRV